MTCFSELTYSIFVDGELPEAEARAVETHTATCARCRSLVAQLRAENKLIGSALQSADDLATAPLKTGLGKSWPWLATAIPLTAAAVLLSSGLQSLAQLIPGAANWLNPSDLTGRLNLVSAAAFYVVDKGAAMLSSLTSFATVLIVLAIVFFAGIVVSRRGLRIMRPGAGLLALLLVTIPGFGLEHRSSKTVVTIGGNETIDDSVLATGDTVRVDGTVNGDLLAFARRVEVRGNIKGDLITWAQRIEVSGTVDGNIYIGAQSADFSGQTGHNVYGWMQSFNLLRTGRIGGGLVLGGADMGLDGNVTRSVTAFGGTVDVGGEVGRDVTFRGGRLSLSPGARVGGNVTAKVNNTQDVRIASGVAIGGKTDVSLVVRKSRFAQRKFYFWQAVSFGGALLIGLLMMLLAPGFFHGALQLMRSAGRSLGLGFAVLVATPVAIIILCITLIGLPVAAFALALYVAALYMAKIFVGALLGQVLLKPADTRTSRTFLALLVGLVIIYLVVQIPYGIGTLLHLAIFCFGIGAFTWRLYRTYRPLAA